MNQTTLIASASRDYKPPVPFLCFKWLVYSLLAINIAIFFSETTMHEGLDSLGWVMLLGIFEWETRTPFALQRRRTIRFLGTSLQVAAFSMILFAWMRYAFDSAWLDFVNATVWLGVVALLSVEMLQAHKRLEFFSRLHYVAKLALYGTLMVLALLWAIRGEWLNCYDASLWIVCFFVIELNLLQPVWAKKSTKQKEPFPALR